MENASKALIMAAGVLIAIMIISILIYAFNNMSGVVQTQLTKEEEEKLAQFNAEFESYNRNGLTGFDMLSLVNKVIDYNILHFQNPDEKYSRLDVKFSLKNNSSTLLSGASSYTTKKISEGAFKKGKVPDDFFSKMSELEKTYGGREVLSRLVSVYDTEIKGKQDEERNLAIRKALMLDSDERLPNAIPSDKELEQYQAYIEFKREEKFNCINTEYKDGRIVFLEFKQQ